MKRILFSFFLMLIITQSLKAQLNSVLLKDGNGLLISQHLSIADAYNNIPAVLTQPYIIEITNIYDGSNESYPVTFIAKSGASSTNTITLRPDTGVTAVSVTATSTGTSLIRLDDADYIIIDGRPGGTGTTKALTIDNQGTGTTSYGIHLINGATNNLFRYFNVQGFFSTSSGGRGIYIQTSASNPSGNSDNTFEFLTFGEGPRYQLNSSGTAANKNNNIKIYGCEFKDIKFCGWWQQSGTGKVTIDSCFFYSDVVGGGTTGTGVFPILSDSQSDTIIITRNHIYNIDNSANTTDVIGMAFRSFSAGSVLRIYNNFVSPMAPNPSVDELFGIELGTNSMANPVDAEIYFNTVSVGGTATGGTSGNLNSAAFSLDKSIAGANINVRNNIFVNERTGGNENHVAVAFTANAGNIIIDYNTYNDTSGEFAKYLTAYYLDFASYQSAVAPLESNSNNAAVQFASLTDLHLAGTSIGNTALAGINITGITTDIDNDLRSIPYRGADEAIIPGCFDLMLNHQISLFTSPSICIGDSAGMTVIYNPQDTTSQIDVQWQSSSDNISFINIPSATSDTLYASPSGSTFYRYELTCQSTGSIAYSSSQFIEITPPPSISTINHTNTGLNYSFTAVTNQSPTQFHWDFGDGNTQSGTNTISHTYTSAGSYTVTLIAENNCGATDTFSTNITITGIEQINGSIQISLFPNPANEFIIVKAENIIGIEIYSVKGNLITGRESTRTGEFILNTNQLNSAIYFIKVITSDGTAVRKFKILK